MYKDFDSWNHRKKIINNISFSPDYIHEREIWWCSLGFNIGEEQDGKNSEFERPVLIIKKFNKNIVLIVPLSTKNKDNIYYFKLNNLGSSVIISQLRLISTKRLIRKIKKIKSLEFDEMRTYIVNHIFR